jgi:hypothetical protein
MARRIVAGEVSKSDTPSSTLPSDSPFCFPAAPRKASISDHSGVVMRSIASTSIRWGASTPVPPSRNQYSRLPKARRRRWRTKLLVGCEQPSIFPVANRLAASAASSLTSYQTLGVVPSGTTLSSTKRRRAVASYLASATIPTLRPRMHCPRIAGSTTATAAGTGARTKPARPAFVERAWFPVC